MWIYVLFVVISFVVPNDEDIHYKAKALKEFSTQQECEKERERITQEFITAYPQANDYRLVCDKRKQKERMD